MAWHTACYSVARALNSWADQDRSDISRTALKLEDRVQRVNSSLRGVAALAIGLIALWAGPLEAASIVCSATVGNNPPISDNVTPTTGCEIGSDNNDVLNPPQVNLDSMFGFSDWIFAEKVLESPEQDHDLGLQVSGGVISGIWSIDDVWTTMGVSDVMLVFKGGNGRNLQPDDYVGYLLAFGATSGAFETPFTNGNAGNPTGISHISAYYRVNIQQIPEPGLLTLMGFGFAVAARRIRRIA